MFEVSDTTEAPTKVPLLPPMPDEKSDGTRMMTLWASEYVLNTLGYRLQNFGFFEFNLTKEVVSFSYVNIHTTSVFFPL